MRLNRIALICCLLACFADAAEEKVKTGRERVADAAKKNQETAEELNKVANGLAPSTGKVAVIKRLEALFRGSAKPIVQTKEFKPMPPYIQIHDLPAKSPELPPRALILYRFRFLQTDKNTTDAVEGIVGENGTVEISEKQNMVIINLDRNCVEAVKSALLSLDQPMPQILVETQIVEVLLEQGEERSVSLQYSKTTDGVTSTYGYNLTQPGQNLNSGQTSGFDFSPITSSDGSEQLRAMVNWLGTSSDAKILASPNIIADLGTSATMTTGEDLPYTEATATNTSVTQSAKFKKTGINLTIKPLIINEDTVRLEVKPEIMLAVRYQTFSQTATDGSKSETVIPVVSIRNLSTTLTAANGEIIMLGGLYSSEVTESLRKTPFMSEIPVLGDLFTAKNMSIYDKQLIFFMKIHILKTPYSILGNIEENAAVIQDVGHTLRSSDILFRKKEKANLEDQQSRFNGEKSSFWDPKAFFPEIRQPDETGSSLRAAPLKNTNAFPEKSEK